MKAKMCALACPTSTGDQPISMQQNLLWMVRGRTILNGMVQTGRNINNLDTSAVGFVKGNLSKPASAAVDRFIDELSKGLNLWVGPLNYQDGSVFLKKGEKATDQQIWYLPQLLEAWKANRSRDEYF